MDLLKHKGYEFNANGETQAGSVSRHTRVCTTRTHAPHLQSVITYYEARDNQKETLVFKHQPTHISKVSASQDDEQISSQMLIVTTA